MKYRVMSGCVTVTGPPRAIWSLNDRHHAAAANPARCRTARSTNSVQPRPRGCQAPARTSRPRACWQPITDVGLTALSVEIITNLAAPRLGREQSARPRGADDVILDGLARGSTPSTARACARPHGRWPSDLIYVQNLPNPALVGDVADQRLTGQVLETRGSVPGRSRNICVLHPLDQQQLLGFEARDLPAQSPRRSAARTRSPSTTLTANVVGNVLGVQFMASRPSKSSMSTGRIWLTCTRPSIRSLNDGTVWNRRFSPLQVSISLRTSRWAIDGSASSTSSTLCCSQMRGSPQACPIPRSRECARPAWRRWHPGSPPPRTGLRWSARSREARCRPRRRPR